MSDSPEETSTSPGDEQQQPKRLKTDHEPTFTFLPYELDETVGDHESDSDEYEKISDEDSNSGIVSTLTNEQVERIKQKMQMKKNQPKLETRPVEMEQDDFEFSDYSESEFDTDDIAYDMLEEGIQVDGFTDKHSMPIHEERKKIVLKKREQDYFEVLPEGWIEITHTSGMPVYLHKSTRVCTFAKPYYLGPGSARQHEVPISAIPCLAYRKEIEKEKLQPDLMEAMATNVADDLTKTSQQSVPLCENSEMSLETISLDSQNENSKKSQKKSPAFSAKVETVKANKKERSLNFGQLRDYCGKVFEFQEITIRKFKTWADRRKHLQLRKMAQRPSLPEGTKLITCPMPKNKESSDTPGRNLRKEFVMNPAGKSSVCILHEFVQHTERVQPKYVFKELENASTPYSATVVINSMQYGIGYGSSKKQAKSEAARATLEILIPDMRELSEGGNKKPDSSTGDLSFFDEIKVEDLRVSELCVKAGQHSPYQILVECLRRNCGMGDTDISTSVRLVKHQKNEFTMKVGAHKALVICRNKREGKQRAAQGILQLLHPQINNWGSLLRLYGRGSCKTPKEKKEEEQRITELQNTASTNRPNYAILNKLREEMLKLREEQKNLTPFTGVLSTIKSNEQSSTATPPLPPLLLPPLPPPAPSQLAISSPI